MIVLTCENTLTNERKENIHKEFKETTGSDCVILDRGLSVSQIELQPRTGFWHGRRGRRVTVLNCTATLTEEKKEILREAFRRQTGEDCLVLDGELFSFGEIKF